MCITCFADLGEPDARTSSCGGRHIGSSSGGHPCPRLRATGCSNRGSRMEAPDMTALVERVEIPKCEGGSLTMRAGQELRVVAVEGPQAADLVAWNADDIRESVSSWLTRHMSHNFGMARDVYTKLPAGRVMFEVLDPRPGMLWLSPGRCNRLKYGDPDHPNCQDILAATIEPYGLSAFDVPEVLNIFMNPRLHDDGTYE